MSPCDHKRERYEWVAPDPDWFLEPGEWRFVVESTTEELDLGRFRCTQCQEVMYYTGLWRQHWEGGRKLLDERTGHVKI